MSEKKKSIRNKLIIISGTPATGKKTLAKKLAKRLNFKLLNIQPIIKTMAEGYDHKKKCWVVDVKKLNRKIIPLIKGRVIVSSHLSHYLPLSLANLCIVTKCSDLKELKKRLKRRGYSHQKTEENILCEIFDLCLNQAKENGHQILVVDTSQKYDLKKITLEIKQQLKILSKSL